MTREEARKLLSGYATGSLTELERQLLFDAALEDQELFDELAAEHAVKELVELPGAKRRLLEALGPEERSFVWWPWATGLAAVVIGAVLWVNRPASAPEEVARVEPPITIAPGVPAPAPAPVVRDAAPVAEEKAVAPEEKAVAPKVADGNAVIREETTPVPAALETRAQLQLPVLVPQPQPGPAAFTQGFAARTNAPTGGGTLTYEVRDTGILRLTPSRDGVLEVTFDGRALYPARPVTAGNTVDVSIPLEAQRLRIQFAISANAPQGEAQSGPSSGTVQLPTVIEIPAQK